MTTHWSVRLTALGARCEAVIWAKTQPDAATAWRTCRRGDWMLWVAAQAGVDRKRNKSLKSSADIVRKMIPIPEGWS